MVPTIDISVFAWVTVIGQFLRTAWHYIRAGWDWLLNKALAGFLTSKFWGLALGIAITFAVVGILVKIFKSCYSYLVELVVNIVFSGSEDVLAVCKSIGFSTVLDLTGFGLATVLTYRFLICSASVKWLLVSLYKFSRDGWKI